MDSIYNAIVGNSFASLHAKIGCVPLERIHAQPCPGSATEDDVVREYRRNKYLNELVDGMLIHKTVGLLKSVMNVAVACGIGNYLKEHDHGVMLGASCFYRLQPGVIRCPGVSFVRWSDIPGDELPDDEITNLRPALVVETITEDNPPQEVNRLVEDYFSGGVETVWVIDSVNKTFRSWETLTRCEWIEPDGEITGGKVLPKFNLSVKRVFESDRRRKKPT